MSERKHNGSQVQVLGGGGASWNRKRPKSEVAASVGQVLRPTSTSFITTSTTTIRLLDGTSPPTRNTPWSYSLPWGTAIKLTLLPLLPQ